MQRKIRGGIVMKKKNGAENSYWNGTWTFSTKMCTIPIILWTYGNVLRILCELYPDIMIMLMKEGIDNWIQERDERGCLLKYTP